MCVAFLSLTMEFPIYPQTLPGKFLEVHEAFNPAVLCPIAGFIVAK